MDLDITKNFRFLIISEKQVEFVSSLVTAAHSVRHTREREALKSHVKKGKGREIKMRH